MRKILTFLLAICMLCACTKKPADKAKQFIEAGMYGDAIPLLEEEIQKNPKNTEAHYLLGMAFLNLGEEDGASQSFDRAIKLDQKKYTKKTTEAYHKTGLNFLGQDTPAGVRRGLRYLNQALDADSSLRSEISKTYRDRGIELAKTDRSLSYTLLSKALELNPDLKRDNDFYYALYIENVKDPELQNKGCEDFLSLFPESKHVENVLYIMGNYQYSMADFQKAKQYFSQLGDRYPDTELGKKAKVMVDNITKMEQEIGQVELERARMIKQMEIEKAEKLKQMEIESAQKQRQMEIEKAEKLKQMEIEAANKKKQLEIQQAQRQKEQELRKLKEFANIANLARVTVSSVFSAEFKADNVKDGIIGINGRGEWASRGEGRGAWVQLTWPSEMEVSKILLYDRPNLDDQVLQAILSFSDGSEVTTGSLPNDGGSPLVITLTSYKEITWLKFTVVNSHGPNLGLCEIEVLGR